MKIGYACVSMKDQNLSLQLDALEKEGCEKMFQEKATGGNADREELKKLLEHLREGDRVVIWKLDRLGRSLRDLVNLVTDIQANGAGLKSLNDSIDTTTPQGKLTFHLFAALAEFEREIIRERTKAGLESARGRVGGRPKGLTKDAKDKAIIASSLYDKKQMTVAEICKHLGIAKSTFYKYLAENLRLGNQ